MKKSKYSVCITETLERVVTVTANSKEDAIDKVTSKYKKSKIILDSNDFTGVEFNIW